MELGQIASDPDSDYVVPPMMTMDDVGTGAQLLLDKLCV